MLHIRVVNGRVFFRYGSFLEDAKKLRRANLVVKLIVDAVTEHQMGGGLNCFLRCLKNGR